MEASKETGGKFTCGHWDGDNLQFTQSEIFFSTNSWADQSLCL